MLELYREVVEGEEEEEEEEEEVGGVAGGRGDHHRHQDLQGRSLPHQSFT